METRKDRTKHHPSEFKMVWLIFLLAGVHWLFLVWLYTAIGIAAYINFEGQAAPWYLIPRLFVSVVSTAVWTGFAFLYLRGRKSGWIKGLATLVIRLSRQPRSGAARAGELPGGGEMSIIRFAEGDFYIYATDGDYKYEMFYRSNGRRHWAQFADKPELRARVEELLAGGLQAPSDLLDRIDRYEYVDC